MHVWSDVRRQPTGEGQQDVAVPGRTGAAAAPSPSCPDAPGEASPSLPPSSLCQCAAAGGHLACQGLVGRAGEQGGARASGSAGGSSDTDGAKLGRRARFLATTSCLLPRFKRWRRARTREGQCVNKHPHSNRRTCTCMCTCTCQAGTHLLARRQLLFLLIMLGGRLLPHLVAFLGGWRRAHWSFALLSDAGQWRGKLRFRRRGQAPRRAGGRGGVRQRRRPALAPQPRPDQVTWLICSHFSNASCAWHAKDGVQPRGSGSAGRARWAPLPRAEKCNKCCTRCRPPAPAPPASV